MAYKIAAGLGMLVPISVYAIWKETNEEESLNDTVKRCAKNTVTFGGAVGLGFITSIGCLHLLQGVYEVSPKICPREG